MGVFVQARPFSREATLQLHNSNNRSSAFLMRHGYWRNSVTKVLSKCMRRLKKTIRAYMAMEYISGKSLAQVIAERGAIPEDEAVRYICQIGAALREVHRAQLLHRDIAPDNIMLTAAGRPVLIDFGTASNLRRGKQSG